MRVLLLLIEWIAHLLVGAALLRAWMNGLRLNMRVQPGLFVMALSDWLVKPLRRWMPQGMARGRLDWGSLLAALILCGLYALLVSLLLGGRAPWRTVDLLGLGLMFLIRTALQTWSVCLLALVIISWVQPGSALHAALARVMAPLLQPLRRAVPPIGGLDLSAALLLLLLQLLLVALG